MKADLIFGNTLGLLERSLNLRADNQKLIVSNLANLDTPNYKAFKMMVAEQMERASVRAAPMPMARTHSSHMAPHTGQMANAVVERVESNPRSIRGDGNTVELETEMSNLAENTLLYNTATRIVANKFNLLKSVIKGGT
ncbi:MAG: flagellar basal body rod protein FlgB [Desulfobacterales bacterium]|nr:flagellar basal body rod protein FlgB [Desulfobacterales bacterium]